jgi:hypothetical protein
MSRTLLSSQMRRKERTKLRGSMGRPGPRGEHEPGFRPGGAHVHAVGGLAFGLELQRLGGRVEQRQAPLSGLGLDRREEQLAADSLQLLVNLDRSAVEVDVIPAETEHLPAPQAIEDEQDERRVQRVRPGSGEEGAGLVSSPGADSAALPLRQLDQTGDVAHNEFSRTARVSAALSTVRMTCTLRTESPVCRRRFKNSWTIGTVKLMSFRLPRPGFK